MLCLVGELRPGAPRRGSRAARYWEYVPLYSTSVPVRLLRLAVDVDDTRDRLVEQVEVVAHDEQRAAVRAQELEQPGAGVGVEVVGRLVEQQQVAAAEEDAHELDAPPLTAGERAEGERRGGRRAGRRRRRACAPPPRPRSHRPTRTRSCAAPKRSMLRLRRRLVHRDPQLLERAAGARRARARRARGRGPSCRRAPRRPEGPGRGSRWRRRGGRPRPEGESAPPSTRSSVVLPAPLRPTRPTLSPGRTCSVTPSTIRLPADLDHQVLNGQHGKQLQGTRGRGPPWSRARDRSGRPIAWRDADGPDESVQKPRWRGRIHLGRVRGVDPGRAGAGAPGARGCRPTSPPRSSPCRSPACSAPAPCTTPATGRRTHGRACSAWTTR